MCRDKAIVAVIFKQTQKSHHPKEITQAQCTPSHRRYCCCRHNHGHSRCHCHCHCRRHRRHRRNVIYEILRNSSKSSCNTCFIFIQLQREFRGHQLTNLNETWKWSRVNRRHEDVHFFFAAPYSSPPFHRLIFNVKIK